jgi:hypothetical protein
MFVPRQDPLLWIYLHPHVSAFPQKIHSQSLYQKNCLIIFHLTCNIVKAFQSQGHHILALELDMKVFTEVLEPFIQVTMLEPDVEHVHNFGIDYPVKKCSSRLLDCE